jgi:hypothetical protein
LQFTAKKFEIIAFCFVLCIKAQLFLHRVLGAIQKIRVKIGGREGSSHLTQNVTVREGGVLAFNM